VTSRGEDMPVGGANADLRAMTDAQLLLVRAGLERRRPGTPLLPVGIRPRRRPWTYRDIWRLEAARAECARRGLGP